LLEVYYARAGHGRDPLPEQRRFCDGSVDAYLRRLDALQARGVSVGIAPHSVRAVGLDDLRVLTRSAHDRGIVLHIHLSEQPRENEECHAEHGMSPTQLLAEVGALEPPRGLTAVHAIHVTDEDRDRLAEQNVCVCPTTEADLGDGIVDAAAMRRAGINLALGSDSNAVVDLVQEARLLEMHDRLASLSRLRLNDEQASLGATLLHIASAGGALALGQEAGDLLPGRALDAVAFDLGHPFFAGIDPDFMLDALFTAGTANAVRHVLIDGLER
jgi:formimidoylglutamate deiminase